MYKRIIGIVTGGLLTLAGAPAAAQQGPAADIVLFNGKVLTVDTDQGEFTVAEGVAVGGGEILAVGTSDRVLALAGENTRRIDLRGKTVMPGIIDTHAHPTQYAGYRTAPEMAPEIAATHMIEGPRLNVDMRESLRLMLGQLEVQVREDLKAPAADDAWLYYLMRSAPGDADAWFFREFDRHDLDQLSPVRPMLVDADGNLMVNSAGLEALQKQVPLIDIDPERDAGGEMTGRLGPRANTLISSLVPDSRRDFFPGKDRLPYKRRIDLLARSFQAELRDHWARYGITTIASKLDAEEHAALSKLDQAGLMPVRWAYHVESFRTPGAAEFMARNMPNYQGYGSPRLWMAGIYGGSADSYQCTTLQTSKKHLESCDLLPRGPLWDSLYPAVRAGFRISGFHVHGDLAVDHILLMIEQASAEGGMTPEDIRDKRHVLDHCAVNPRPDQIERAKNLGVTWTCGPKYIIRAPISAEDYDPAEFARYVVPFKSLIAAGLKPGFHTDGDQGGPMLFKYMETAVTRKDLNGHVWNESESIGREDVLRTATRWNAANLLRGDVIGSIEEGKWADLIVIDRDYMSVPVNELGQIKVLLTLLGGEIIYQARDAGL